MTKIASWLSWTRSQLNPPNADPDPIPTGYCPARHQPIGLWQRTGMQGWGDRVSTGKRSIVRNERTGHIVGEDIEDATGLWGSFKGLMFSLAICFASRRKRNPVGSDTMAAWKRVRRTIGHFMSTWERCDPALLPLAVAAPPPTPGRWVHHSPQW